MIVWDNLPSKDGLFFSGDLSGSLEAALPQALQSVVAKLSESRESTGEVTMSVEVGVDTGRIIAALESSQRPGLRDGCAVRLQSLQDVWYDLDEAGVDDEAFTSEVQRMRRKIGNDLFTFLQREGRQAFPEATSLRLILRGGEPGEIMDENVVFSR